MKSFAIAAIEFSFGASASHPRDDGPAPADLERVDRLVAKLIRDADAERVVIERPDWKETVETWQVDRLEIRIDDRRQFPASRRAAGAGA